MSLAGSIALMSEHTPMKKHHGSITVLVGGMFSGKSELLIHKLRRGVRQKERVLAIKPSIDNRYSATDLASHGGHKLGAVTVSCSADIPGMVGDATLVGIDELQFFDVGIVDVAQDLAAKGVRVILAGLDMDFRGVPFGPVPHMMAVADDVVKLKAVCVVCGGEATRSQRIVDSHDLVLVGETSAYEARCRGCWGPEPVFATSDGNVMGSSDE